MLRVGFFTPVHGLDPEAVQDYVCAQAIEQIYDAPFVLEGGRPRPLLLEGPLTRSPSSGGGVELVGTVRPDARFSDGSPVTADDVVASLCRVPAVAERARMEAHYQVVRFVLPEDDPRFEARLSQRWASIVRRQGDALLGTGPFVVRPGWTPEHVVLDRNPHALRKARIEGVELRVYPPSVDGRPEALKRAISEGEVDLTTVLSRDDVAELKGVRKDFQPGNSTAMLALNVDRPALAEVEVRRAIVEAIDRAAMAGVSHDNPHAFAARSLLPPTLWRGTDGVRHDPDQARQRLRAAGSSPSQPLRMLTIWGPRPYLPAPRRTAELVRRQLDAVGLPVEIVPSTDSKDYFARTSAGAYDMVLMGWIADSPDPLDFLDAVLASRSVPTPARAVAYASNLSRYRSAAMDGALEAYRRDATEAALHAVMEQMAKDAPLCPLFHGANIVVHGWNVREVELTGAGIPRLDRVELD